MSTRMCRPGGVHIVAAVAARSSRNWTARLDTPSGTFRCAGTTDGSMGGKTRRGIASTTRAWRRRVRRRRRRIERRAGMHRHDDGNHLRRVVAQPRRLRAAQAGHSVHFHCRLCRAHDHLGIAIGRIAHAASVDYGWRSTIGPRPESVTFSGPAAGACLRLVRLVLISRDRPPAGRRRVANRASSARRSHESHHRFHSHEEAEVLETSSPSQHPHAQTAYGQIFTKLANDSDGLTWEHSRARDCATHEQTVRIT
jgi:hypothetical protein